MRRSLQATVLGFLEPGYIEIGSSNLTQDASIGFSFQTEQSDCLLLLAKGSIAVSHCTVRVDVRYSMLNFRRFLI